VVAVNGVCTGAGLHFVADADVVVASSTATFLDTHVSVGQVAAIEPITLLARIGLGSALRLTVLGRHGRIGADEALRIGLVDEVVEPARLRARAAELAEQAASGSPAAIEASKRAIRGALELPMRDAMQAGWELLLSHRDHPDSGEGPRAFAEKREAKWQ
jgi:enoyl-CoA hydratase/carnithine racemase